MGNVTSVQFESELAKFFEYSNDMLCIAGIDGYFKEINLAWEKHLGYSKKELLQVPFINFVHPDDTTSTTEEMKKIKKGESVLRFINRYKHKEGGYRILSWTAFPSGESIYCVARDITEEKSKEQKFNHYEQFISLFSEAPFFIAIYSGPEFIIEWANPTFQNIFPNKNILGKKLIEIIPKFEEQGIFEILKNIYATGGSFIGNEFPVWTNNRTRVEYYTFFYHAKKNTQGKVEGVIVLGSNVTKQVLARKTSEEIANKFEILFESIPHIAWTNDRNGTINYFNSRWFAYTRFKFESAKDLGWKSAIHPEDLKKFLTISASAYSRDEGFEMECRIKRGSDGMYRWHLLKSTPIKNEKGEAYLWIGTATDIEDRKISVLKLEKMANELAESEERLKLAMEAMELGTWETYLTKGERFWTPRAKKIVGLPEDAIITDNTFLERVYPEDQPYVKDTLQAALKGHNNGKFDIEYRIVRYDNNEVRWIKANAQVYFDKNKNPIKVIGTVHDITDSKLAIKRLQETNQQLVKTNIDLDNFVYTASHDLKAPVSNIEGLINALQYSLVANKVKDEEIAEIVKLMNISVQRFQSTIKDLTEIAKVQKRREEDIVDNDIVEVVEEIKASLEPLIQKSNATIFVNPSYCKSIRFSKADFRSILYNLISNSIKYKSFERDPIVEIRSYSDKKYCILEVKDNGLGIKEDNLKQIFKMFKRFHTHVEGTGIGLYIVKRAIENAGGKISIQSVLGEGTTVKVYFPGVA
ncbi:MAG TPA: PAS domain-containing protein [Cytophagaceae bacterium]